ncbi:dihydrofolate reductase family protein [Conexibacter woesei]|uniref:dihydrofolate reductase family protein n=1 Tax=Conexibacter woesei TaxID=191495 RepID=UPI00047BA3EC|nr:dihydrofolate reductase family protein [Conexibacter woesei]
MSAKLVYGVTMSLDGFIAGPGGDMGWLTPHIGPNPAVPEFIAQVGALLVGHRTFLGDDPHKSDAERAGKPFGGGWEGLQVVLTHHPEQHAEPIPDVVFVSDLDDAIDRAQHAAGDGRVVNVLGAQTARACLDAGRLDELLVFIAPVLLGDGTRLFERPGGADVRLERLEVDARAERATLIRFRVL